MLEERATTLAKAHLSMNAQNMFLEAQPISADKAQFLINELKQDLLRAGGRVLWRNEKGTVDN